MTTPHLSVPAVLAQPAVRAVINEVIAYEVTIVLDERKGFLADHCDRRRQDIEDVLSLALDAPVRFMGVKKEPAPCSHHCSQHQ